MKKSLILLLVVFLTGCATVFRSPSQYVTVVPIGTQDRVNTCSLTNEEGNWSGFPNAPIKIERDGNPMSVECSGDNARGTVEAKPDFGWPYLALNLLFDLCIISCPVDGLTNSFYSYPETIVVPMSEPK